MTWIRGSVIDQRDVIWTFLLIHGLLWNSTGVEKCKIFFDLMSIPIRFVQDGSKRDVMSYYLSYKHVQWLGIHDICYMASTYMI